jgi:hypothetical protein
VAHLIHVWPYDIDQSTGRKPSAALDSAIDATIRKYLGGAAAMSAALSQETGR